MTEGTQTQQFPCPDPALRRLDWWKTEGHLPDSDEIVIRGETSFRWLPGGFFPSSTAPWTVWDCSSRVSS
jgi:hypothetical protein